RFAVRDRCRQFGDLEGIGAHEREPGGAIGTVGRLGAGESLHGLRQSGGEELVDLYGRDTVPGLEQSEGERAQPGAALDDVRGVREAGGGDDRAHGIGVDDEVLPLLLRRAQTDVSGYLAYVACGQ